MASVGNLAVEMSLNQAKFTGDLGKVVASVDNAAKRMQSSLRGVVSGFVGGLAGILSIRAFVGIIDGAIESADRLNDLSQSTGIAVETLGGLGFVASKSGSDLEKVATGINRLNLQIAAAKGGGEEAIKTFKALGISTADLRDLTNDEVLFRVADRFRDWGDGANQAAVASRLFGKAFADQIPFLNEGGESLRTDIEYYKKYSGITTEVAKRADEFKDTTEKLNLLNRAFAVTLASALLPTLDRVAEAYIDSAEKGEGFKDVAEQIAVVFRGLAATGVVVSGVFQGVGKSIGVTAAQFGALIRGEFSIARQLGKEFEQENQERIDRQNKLLDALMNPGTVTNRPRKRLRRPDAPDIPSSSVDADADSTARKILDGQLKALEGAIREEADLLKVRERFLQDYFRDDVIAFSEYFDTRRGLIADNLAKEVAAYDEQIRVLREAQKNLTKASEREDVENKIADVVAKRSKAERDASVESINLFREQEKEAQKFRDTIEQVSIELARMNGETAIAALASFDLQNRELRKRIDLERQSGDEEIRRQANIADVALRALRDRTAAQAALNEVTQRFGQAIEGLGITQERIGLSRRKGAIDELESLQKISDANRAVIDGLREQERAAVAAMEGLSGPALDAALLGLERMRLQIEELESETDLLGDKFRGVFRESFTDAFTDLISGTKSFKEAFKDMADSIVQQINRIVAQNIGEALFGGAKGGGGGNQGFFGGFIGDLFKGIFGGGFADGGFPPVGRVSLVGERGPELIMPRGTMQVVPNRSIGSSNSLYQTINFYNNGPIDTHSQSQLAAASYRGAVRGQRNL